MRKENLILTAIVAAAIGIGFYFKDNISSYLEQKKEMYQKRQEIRIPYSDLLLTKSLGTDGINKFYRFNLDGIDIAIEVTNKDTLTTKVDSLVIVPENVDLSSNNRAFPIYKIKKKIY